MTTYYVKPSTGNNANAGTSAGAAWQTLQKALDTAVAGDVVRLCAEAVETTTVTIDVDTQSGTLGSHIRFRGYDATGTTPAPYTVRAVASWGGGPLVNLSTSDYVRFEDIIFDANALATYALSNAATGANICTFVRCSFTGGTSGGFMVSNTAVGARWRLFECHAYGNTGPGFTTNTTSGIAAIIGGSYHDNTGDGIYIGDNPVDVWFAQVYDNGGAGINVALNTADSTIVGACTVYGNGGDGIVFGASSECGIAVGNILAGNTGAGIGNATNEAHIFDYNLFHGNAGTYTTTPDDAGNDVSGDPLFADTTDGSEDFTPASGSPAVGAGLNGSTIGAVGAASGGGTRVYGG